MRLVLQVLQVLQGLLVVPQVLQVLQGLLVLQGQLGLLDTQGGLAHLEQETLDLQDGQEIQVIQDIQETLALKVLLV